MTVGDLADSEHETWLITPASYGPFRLKMSLDQARVLDPDLEFGAGPEFDGCQAAINLSTSTYAIFDQHSQLIWITSPVSWVTDKGLKSGNTQGKARKIYGPEVPPKKLLAKTHFPVGPAGSAQYTFGTEGTFEDPHPYYGQDLPDSAIVTTVTLNVPGACVNETTE